MRILGVLILLLVPALASGAGLILSPGLPEPGGCEAELLLPGASTEINAKDKPDRLYQETSRSYWEIDDYGSVFRFSALKRNVGEQFVVEEFNPSLDIGPSPVWIQYLQSLGLMPAELSSWTYTQVENYLHGMGLTEAYHPLREPHLQVQRQRYIDQLKPSYHLAMKEYERRAWFTPEFQKGAERTLHRTLRTATYLVVRYKQTGEVLAVMRLVRVHNARLSLRHLKTGRTLQIQGNAEWMWGVGDQPRFSRDSLLEMFQVKKLLPDFLQGTETNVNRVSELEPLEMVKLPMEIDFKLDLPRDYLPLVVKGKKGFENGNTIVIGGEKFAVELEHAVVVEPGLFAIKKTPERAQVFLELAIWQSKYLANPRLPSWVPARSVKLWTYNDLPLYTIYNFKEDDRFEPIQKYGVNWRIYGGGVDDVQAALQGLAGKRANDSPRSRDLQYFLKEMEKRGF